MAEDIQGFIDRIRTEGIEKADAEKEKILSDAKKQAEAMIVEAQAKASKIVADAEAEAKLAEAKGSAAVQQAARDVMIALRQDMLARLKAFVKNCSGEAMTPELMGKLVLETAKAWREKNPDGECSVELLAGKESAAALEKQLASALLADLKLRPVIKVGKGIDKGLQIGFSGSDVYLDFTDDALAEMICEFAGPRITAVLKG